MKRITAIIGVSVLISSLNLSASARVTDVETVFDAKSGKLTVSGSASGITSVMITEDGKTPEDYSVSHLPVDYHQLYANGKFGFEFNMPKNSPNGKYEVYVTDGENAEHTDFMYFESSASADAISRINNASDKADFILKAEQYGRDLGIDTSSSDYSSDILSVMYEVYPNYSDAVEFYERYRHCAVIHSLKGKSQSQTEQILSEKDTVLGIDYEKDYASNSFISSDAKAKLCSLLSEMDYIKARGELINLVGLDIFSDVYDTLCALSVVATEDSWKKIEHLYKSDDLFLKEKILDNNADYAKVSASEVFINMSQMEYNNISDLKDNFDSAVSMALESQGSNKPSGGSGGSSYQGGGGGSLSGGGVQYEELPGASGSIRATVGNIGSERAQYTDVNQDDWYYDAVTLLGGAKVVNGYADGSFLPANNITRAEFAKLIVEAFEVEAPNQSFDDVAEDKWYAPYVKKAAGAGIILGYQGIFSPDNYITRQDAAVILYRVATIAGHTYTGFAKTSDMNDVSAYAWPAVGAFYDCGIVNGAGDGKFLPLSNITRAEAVQMILKVASDLQTRF